MPSTVYFVILVGGLMAKCLEQTTQIIVSISRFPCARDWLTSSLSVREHKEATIPQTHGLTKIAYYLWIPARKVQSIFQREREEKTSRPLYSAVGRNLESGIMVPVGQSPNWGPGFKLMGVEQASFHLVEWGYDRGGPSSLVYTICKDGLVGCL